MIARSTLIVAAALLALPTAAFADDKPAKKEKWVTKVVGDKPKPVVIDPTKAYILVRAATQIAPVIMRIPNEEAAAAHAVKRAEAFGKAHRTWRNKIATIEMEARVARTDPNSRRKPPEPIEADFGYPSYEQQNTAYLGPQNRFSKVDGSVYLQEVPPGEYLFYAVGATCACLGTVSFEAPAGKIVAVELAPLNQPDGTSPFDIKATNFSDPRLPAGSVVPATLKPAGMKPNWFGISVDRVLPIEGVFSYARGKQVAQSTEAAAPVATAIPTASASPVEDAAAGAVDAAAEPSP